MSQRIEQQAKLQDYKTLAHHYDLLGRRTAKNDEQYGYNVRDELISANERTYAYDDIGNRTVAEGRDYTANNLNQYTAIEDFVPEYDVDGNQTKVFTETGEWMVEYNAENRPIRWTQGNKVITMGFDRMGRRVFYKELEGNCQITYTVFLYNGYLCIQQLFPNGSWNVYKEFIWDPTAPLATRPLCFRQNGQMATFLFHDGNKNVTDVITVGPNNTPVAHYDYAPFGAVTATGARASHNPFRFSSEFHDDSFSLVYYNYRHYNPIDGKWLERDPLEEIFSRNTYIIVQNNITNLYDITGLSKNKERECLETIKRVRKTDSVVIALEKELEAEGCTRPITFFCGCCQNTNTFRPYVSAFYGITATVNNDGKLDIKTGNYVTMKMCTNNLLTSDYAMALRHEFFHLTQFCKEEKRGMRAGTPCEQAICREMQAYATNECQHIKEPELKKRCIRSGALNSSQSVCESALSDEGKAKYIDNNYSHCIENGNLKSRH